jgi:hypothetical protein
VKKQNFFLDVIFNLVSEEVLQSYKSCWMFCNTYNYVIARKEFLKEMMKDMIQYVYKINARIMLNLPSNVYRDNLPDERERFLKITDIGMDTYHE